MRSDYEYSLNYFLKKLNISKGIFVDVGANDGQMGSMTYELEKNGWSGILIEPNPILVINLKKIRTSPVFPYAISSTEGDLPFLLLKDQRIYMVSLVSIIQKNLKTM